MCIWKLALVTVNGSGFLNWVFYLYISDSVQARRSTAYTSEYDNLDILDDSDEDDE